MTDSSSSLIDDTSQVEQRLHAAGLQLPVVRAQGEYAVAVVRGGTVWTAGQLSRTDTGLISGIAHGADDLPQVRYACQVAVLRAIAAVRSVVHLNTVDQVVFLGGFIAASPEFKLHSQALDAASDILQLAFGPHMQRHARSALGVSSLPSGGLVELELIVGIGSQAARSDAKTV